jgi:stage V sporulation protein AC
MPKRFRKGRKKYNGYQKKLDQTNYQNYVKNTMPKSNLLKDCFMAFVVGGLICVLGEAINCFASGTLKLGEEGVNAFRSALLIFLGALFTGIGLYDVLGRYAGAGSIVPITGFANSIVSPLLNTNGKATFLGGRKTVHHRGPVLVYGISSSVLVGIIYFFNRRVMRYGTSIRP